MSSRYDPALKSLDLSDFYHDKGRLSKIRFTILYQFAKKCNICRPYGCRKRNKSWEITCE